MYSLIMSVGGFAITLATSGVNLAATRLCAEAVGRKSMIDVRRGMCRCLIYSFSFGIFAALLLFSLAGPLSVNVLNDKRCILPLRLLSAALPFISMSSALAGYFTAVRRVFKNATVQVCEQFFCIFITVRLIAMLLPKGIEYACAAVILGTAVSGLLAFLFSFAVYRIDLKCHNNGEGERSRAITHELLNISLPVAFSAYVRSGLVSVEHILIPRGLKKYGAGNVSALAAYGTLHGMAMPLVLFPMAVISAFAGLLVPEIAGSLAAGEKRRVEAMVSRAIQLTLAFAIGCSGILVSFGNELGKIIYSDADAGMFIRMMAPLVPVMYFDHIVDGMLKGLGEQVYSMRVNIFDSLLSVCLVALLLPKMGIFGYVVIIYGMEIINTSLSVVRLLSRCELKVDILNWFIKPLCCIIGSTILCDIITPFVIPVGISDGVKSVICICFSLISYYFLLRSCRGIGSEDIRWFRNAIH